MDQTRAIELPADQADELEAQAKAMGMSLPAYLSYLQKCRSSMRDVRFNDAVSHVFKNYPETLKKLAQ